MPGHIATVHREEAKKGIGQLPEDLQDLVEKELEHPRKLCAFDSKHTKEYTTWGGKFGVFSPQIE